MESHFQLWKFQESGKPSCKLFKFILLQLKHQKQFPTTATKNKQTNTRGEARQKIKKRDSCVRTDKVELPLSIILKKKEKQQLSWTCKL